MALSLRQEFVGFGIPSHATQRIAGARRFSDARRTFLHALSCLREYLAQYVGDAAAVRHRPAGLPELVFDLREDVAEIGTGVLARTGTGPGCPTDAAPKTERRLRRLAELAGEFPKDVAKTLAWISAAAAWRGSGWRLALRLTEGFADLAQDVAEAATTAALRAASTGAVVFQNFVENVCKATARLLR